MALASTHYLLYLHITTNVVIVAVTLPILEQFLSRCYNTEWKLVYLSRDYQFEILVCIVGPGKGYRNGSAIAGTAAPYSLAHELSSNYLQ